MTTATISMGPMKRWVNINIKNQYLLALFSPTLLFIVGIKFWEAISELNTRIRYKVISNNSTLKRRASDSWTGHKNGYQWSSVVACPPKHALSHQKSSHVFAFHVATNMSGSTLCDELIMM